MVALTALASAACYALALVLAQIGLRQQSPLAGATVSLPVTAAVMALVALGRVDPAAATPWALAIFAGCGLLFPVSVTLLSFQGNRLLGPNLAGALGNATPLFAVSFGIVILGDHLSAVQAVGLATVLTGIVLLSLRGRLDARRASLLAFGVPLLAAAIRGVVQPLIKIGLASWPDPTAATAIGYGASALVILLISTAVGRGRPQLAAWATIPLFAGVGLLNGASVLLLYSALSLGRVSVVAPLVAIYPLFTLAFSRILLRGEPFGRRLVLGVVVTVLGVALLLAST